MAEIADDSASDDPRITMIREALSRSGSSSQRLAMPSMAAPNPLTAMRMPSAFAAAPPPPDPPGSRVPPPLPSPRMADLGRNESVRQSDAEQAQGLERLGSAVRGWGGSEEDEYRKKIAALLEKAGVDRERVVATQAQPTSAVPSREPLPAFSGDMLTYVKGLTSGLETDPSNPNAINPSTGAAGRFQFQPGTVESLLRYDPALAKQIDDNWRTDRIQQNLLLSRYTGISDNLIKQITGRDPTNPERYTMHFLGHALGPKVVANPDVPIESFLGKEAWEDHLKKNPGLLRPGITGRDLMLKVAPRFKGAE